MTWESYADPRIVNGSREILLPDLRPEELRPRLAVSGQEKGTDRFSVGR